MQGDFLFARVRREILAHGGPRSVSGQNEVIRKIATENHITVAAVRQTIIEMRSDARTANRLNRERLKTMPPAVLAELEQIRVSLTLLSEALPYNFQDIDFSRFQIKVQGTRVSLDTADPETMTCTILLDNNEETGLRFNLSAVLILAALAHIG